LIDWSKNNVVAVTLGQKVYQWNASTGVVDELQEFDGIEAQPTLAKWSKEGQYVAIGFSDGQLKVILII
jgi:cell division cycle 20, cofactor of APC complex